MPARTQIDRRERLVALAAVVAVQAALALVLLSGFRIDAIRHNELVSRLIDVTLTRPPPPLPPPVEPRAQKKHATAAPKAQAAPIGGAPGPKPAHVTPAPTPVVALQPSAPAAGGGSGSGPATGSGAGGGSGGEGAGDDGEGGTDLVQIAGAITPGDYPRDLREQGIGGRVQMVFTVAPTGRVTACTITRSSGVPELDELTCRLIRERFRYRPSTDRAGRPISDEVEGEHDWVAGRR